MIGPAVFEVRGGFTRYTPPVTRESHIWSRSSEHNAKKYHILTHLIENRKSHFLNCCKKTSTGKFSKMAVIFCLPKIKRATLIAQMITFGQRSGKYEKVYWNTKFDPPNLTKKEYTHLHRLQFEKQYDNIIQVSC